MGRFYDDRHFVMVDSMKAKLIIFDSSEDPHWDMTKEESGRLYEILRVLPGTRSKIDEPRDLGYKGITVNLDDGEKLTIFKGYVQVLCSDKEVRKFEDYGREFEMWLFQTAYGRVDNDVYSRLLASEFPV